MAAITTTRVRNWAGGTVATIAVLWGTHQWVATKHLPVHLLSRAEAQTLQQQVSEAATKAEAAATQAQETSEQLSLYLVRTELQALRDKLERAKSELQETLLWESANGGENDISRERKRDLNTRIRETDEQIRCMVNPDAVGC